MPITWGYMKKWAEENHVPDDAVMYDECSGSDISDLSYTPAEAGEPAIFSTEPDFEGE